MPKKHSRELLLLAKSYALDQGAAEIGDEAVFQALHSYRLLGGSAFVKAILGDRTAGDAPLPADEIAARLDRAGKAGELKLSEAARMLAARIEQLPVKLRPLSDAGRSETLPPVLQRVAFVEDALKAVVKGQDAAMAALACRQARSGASVDAAPGPAGLYVLAGAPASGKSLAAKTLADALGLEFFSFDCSPISSALHESLARGEEPTFRGARSGVLTDWVRRHPQCVVELANFARMSPEAHGFLKEILNEGRLKDLYGFRKNGEMPGKETAPPEVDFTGVHLVLEVHGCEELYDRPDLVARIREEGGEDGIRRALVRSLRGLKMRIRQQETPVFSPDLLANLESRACFCLFTPLDSAALLEIVRDAVPAGLEETAARLGLAVAPPAEADLEAAARLLLWERGGAAAAGAFSGQALADRLFPPLYGFLREQKSAPAVLRLELGEATRQALRDIGAELGEEPARALFRSLRRLHCDQRAVLEGDALVLALENPRLVRAPAAEDFGEGPDALVVTVPETRFDDVAGLAEVKAKLRAQVEQARSWRELAARGMRAPGGLLLCGPPGTGKTMLATACAGEFGLPYLATTGARLLDLGFQEKVFARLRKYAPCLLFVDEIDAVCALDAAQNALQAHMDGFAGTGAPPIFVIGATNHPERIAAPLMRPGRLEEAVVVPVPDREARRALLAPAADRMDQSTLDKLLDFTAGMSGAEMHAAARDLALHPGDLDEQGARDILHDRLYGKKVNVSEEMRKQVAFHEAGHATVRLRGGLPEMGELSHISLTFRKKNAGLVHGELQENVFFTWTRERLLAQIAASLGGMVAQSLLAGGKGRVVDGGDVDDLRKANELAHFAVTHGLDEEIGLRCSPDDGKSFQQVPKPLIHERMRVWLEEAENMARDLLKNEWRTVEALAGALLEKGALGRAEIEELAEKYAEAPDGKCRQL